MRNGSIYFAPDRASSKSSLSVDPNWARNSSSNTTQVISFSYSLQTRRSHCHHWLASPSRWHDTRHLLIRGGALVLEELLHVVKPLCWFIAGVRGKAKFGEVGVVGLAASICSFGTLLAIQSRLAGRRDLVAAGAFSAGSDCVCEPLERILNQTELVGHSEFH